MKRNELKGFFTGTPETIWYTFQNEDEKVTTSFSVSISGTWSVKTYATRGNDCKGFYNPTVKIRPDGRGLILTPEWQLEATQNNMYKIISEIERRAERGIKL